MAREKKAKSKRRAKSAPEKARAALRSQMSDMPCMAG